MKKRVLRLVKWVCVLINVLFVVGVGYIAMRVFLIESYCIPSGSMSPEVIEGDHVWVLKPVYGPRILQHFDSLQYGKSTYERWRGLRSVRRNDVVVLNRKRNAKSLGELFSRSFFIKRCIALPGDTLRAVDGYYRVSGFDGPLGDTAQQRILSKLRPAEIDSSIYFLLNRQWNIQQFGPLYLPRKGDTLPIDATTALIYHSVVRNETGKRMRLQNDTVYLEDEPLRQYTFKEDYYFFAGDNVLSSTDSRYWGLVSEREIVALAWCVWYSVDPYTGRWRWDRVLKSIR